jgi:hypothetical protein
MTFHVDFGVGQKNTSSRPPHFVVHLIVAELHFEIWPLWHSSPRIRCRRAAGTGSMTWWTWGLDDLVDLEPKYGEMGKEK